MLDQVAGQHGQTSDDYVDSIKAFRAGREADLVAEDGWLSVVGLDWLEAGDNRIGTSPDSDILLPSGPARLGVVSVNEAGQAMIAIDPQSGAMVDGASVAQARLVDTKEDLHHPTLVRCGTVNFHVVDRDGRKGLRIKDNDATARTGFTHLDYFDIDPAWRIEAEWVPVNPPREIQVGTSWGNVSVKTATHKAVFQVNDKTYELYPVPSQKTDLVFVLADRTSGRETYGACRFLDGEMLSEDRVVLDFNKAINPPCAFSAFATCPIAPPENRLTLRITAGEKAFKPRG
jgi:uncharacterized protein (DUF1684 family)